MRELRSTYAALLISGGLLLGAASSAKAELFTSETQWETATGYNFGVVGYTAGTDYQFFAACPISTGNCVPLSPDTGPIKNPPNQTDESYVEQHSGWTLTG